MEVKATVTWGWSLTLVYTHCASIWIYIYTHWASMWIYMWKMLTTKSVQINERSVCSTYSIKTKSTLHPLPLSAAKLFLNSQPATTKSVHINILYALHTVYIEHPPHPCFPKCSKTVLKQLAATFKELLRLYVHLCGQARHGNGSNYLHHMTPQLTIMSPATVPFHSLVQT